MDALDLRLMHGFSFIFLWLMLHLGSFLFSNRVTRFKCLDIRSLPSSALVLGEGHCDLLVC